MTAPERETADDRHPGEPSRTCAARRGGAGWYSTVGPLPFGHVTDLPRAGWRDAVRELQPDVTYAS